MKNRIIIFLVTLVAISLFGVEKLSAQEFTTSAEGIDLNIDANQDTEVRKTFAYTVNFFNDALHLYNDMELSVRLNEDIANGVGAVINPSKIKIELKEIIEGLRRSQITPTRISLSRQDQTIIEADGKWGGAFSNVRLPAGGGTWTFLFDLIIDENDLSDLENGVYPLSLDFDLSLQLYFFFGRNRWYDSSANSMGMINVVNYAPSFSFEVNANASLNFTTPEDYTKQVENEPNSSWIDVVSKNSDYFIKIKANDPNFQLVRNDAGYEGDSTIPVSVVNVEMDLGNNRYGQSEGAKSLSSATAEILFRGKKKKNKTQKLPVRYFIKKDDAEMLSTKTPGQYITILTYTLEPN